MNNLKELKRHIISNIHDDWSTLEKVRYVYLESGKYLQKHTEFFFSIDDKFTDTKLSPKKLDKIYIGRLGKEEWNKMICKSGAEFIKEVLDELKIKSNLIETVQYIKVKGMKHHIHHFTLCINIDNNNIFVTPASDYPYIKEGMSTKHFGIDVPYIIDGEVMYKGREIPHITLTKQELKEIDDKIGYTTKIVKTNKNDLNEIKNEYLDDVISNDKNMYIDLLANSTSFYQSIMPEDESKREFKHFSDPRNNWNFVIDNICKRVGKRICQITGNKYKNHSFISRSNFNEWCQYIETLIDPKLYNQKEVYYSNPVLLFNKAKALCNSIILFYNKIIHNSVYDDDIKTFNKTFLRLLNETSKHFIDERFVIEPKDSKEYVPNTYINHKFFTLFPDVVDANTGCKTNNNYKGFSENSEIIKRNIEYMFQDLNSKNILKEPDPSFKYSPIFKRINIYSIKRRGEEGYGMYFAITDSDALGTRSSYWYKYDMIDNTFEKTSLSQIVIESSKSGKYEILSNRLKSELEEIEQNEKQVIKPKTLNLHKEK
ncbi:MAG: hypothetical protein J6O56_02555 [Bacilli bacterium]|nr:hypothetical protein [Bacilli bacterium]